MATDKALGPAPNEPVRNEPGAPAPGPWPPAPALERITVLLRHVDTEVAALRGRVSADRQLSLVQELPDLDLAFGPIEKALAAAAETLGLEPAVLDGRKALRGALQILWADLIDMSPENLRKHWGLDDIPDQWPELHRRLVAAVEGAIAQL